MGWKTVLLDWSEHVVIKFVYSTVQSCCIPWIELMIGLIMWSYVLMDMFLCVTASGMCTYFHIFTYNSGTKTLTWFYIYVSYVKHLHMFTCLCIYSFYIALSRFYEFVVSDMCPCPRHSCSYQLLRKFSLKSLTSHIILGSVWLGYVKL